MNHTDNSPSARDPQALTISKIISALNLLIGAAGRRLWHEHAPEVGVAADLTTMLRHADLEAVSLELLHGQTVVYEQRFEFIETKLKAQPGFDLAGSYEIPVLSRTVIDSHRLLVHRRGHDERYRSELRLAWSAAQTLEKEAGSSFASEHALAASGGRIAAQAHVGVSARHTIIVTSTGTAGFAFGKVETLGDAKVYLHERWLPPKTRLHPGQRYGCVLVQTRRGFQARSLEPLAA